MLDEMTDSPLEPYPAPETVVDILEQFFGESVSKLGGGSVAKLPTDHQIDLNDTIADFLRRASEKDYPEDAVVLDCISDPIMIDEDLSSPRTTRRAKQVALLHETVIIPLVADFVPSGPYSLPVLLNWVRSNESLLRHQVFALTAQPDVWGVIGEETIAEIVEASKEFLFHDDQTELLHDLDLNTELLSGGHLTRDEAIENALVCALIDTMNPSLLGTNSTFLDTDSSKFLELLLKVAGSCGEPPPLTDASILETLELPAITQLPDEDFVSIRLQSEDFGEFRSALGRVLEKTRSDAEGSSLQDAFSGNLDEIRWRAELLRRDIKDQTLRKYLGKKWQGYTVGALAGASVAAAKTTVAGTIDSALLAVGTGSAVVFNTLFSLLQYCPAHRKRRMLRFYCSLLGEEADEQ